MKKINLQDLYPFYHNDLFVEVSDEVAAALAEAERMERNYIRRVYWNKAYFSLDAGDGIEHEALFVALSPCELYERKVTTQELRAALNALPDTQGRRVYAHYILGLSKTEIARAEGVAKSRVSESIERGLRNMEKFLKNTF
ncbi:sigma factor-like helix-turn-helix DNA-binding protein [Anaerotruncus colihominis]|uniref:Sigma-70 family RNA polymerase sigma factor n=1 Tax=Anaerotruncus colihominis TaxID=169435 RepID=A0A3E3ISR4_9FIRM|nr:sigma factor-like helix-turn-helix DNA-binding protein [Anaerotruncus colihominis]RGE70104.1 sigma-70 family RNA polymerase sigma factor [Anaerotruncus colihominis]